jgi:two-component system nitrogen regulation response regulator NtrX
MSIQISEDRLHILETLVLDDDSRWRQLVAFNVESHLGLFPFLAANGKEALEILSERQIDVVICDLAMPEMDGLQFLQKAREASARTKVILMSGDFESFPVPPDGLIEQGAIAAIPKTEVSSTLIDVLRFLQDVPQMAAKNPSWGIRTATGWSGIN